MTTKLFCLAILLTMGIPYHFQAQNLKMYISDAGNFNLPPWQILKFDLDGSNGKVFIADHLDWPQDILFLEKENIVLISNLNSGEILRFNATTGDFINAFATGLSGPTRMKIGPDSLLYVLQWTGGGRVQRYHLDGSFASQFSSIGVNNSIGLDWDISGNLYVSSYSGKFVRKYSPNGDDLGKFISTNLAGPTNIWFDSNGDLLVNDYNGSAVKRFDSNGNFKNVFIAAVPQCEGVNFLADGSILLGVGGTSSVRQYHPDGTLAQTIVPTGTLNLLTPNAVVVRDESFISDVTSTEVAEDTRLVTPTIGTLFQFIRSDFIPIGSMAEVSNLEGVTLQRIPLADSTVWDASNLPDGLYIISLHLPRQKSMHQKVQVLH
jgi:sugar lactone lactonase YvrE